MFRRVTLFKLNFKCYSKSLSRRLSKLSTSRLYNAQLRAKFSSTCYFPSVTCFIKSCTYYSNGRCFFTGHWIHTFSSFCLLWSTCWVRIMRHHFVSNIGSWLTNTFVYLNRSSLPIHIISILVIILFLLGVLIHGSQVEWTTRLDYLWNSTVTLLLTLWLLLACNTYYHYHYFYFSILLISG